MPNITRIATAGGWMNPSLNLNLVPDLSGARENALNMQSMRQRNAMQGQALADYPEDRNYLLQQRERAQQQQPIMDARAGYMFMSKVAPTIPDLETYLREQPALVGKFGVPPELAPDLATIQAEAAKTGTDPQTVFQKLKQAYMPQETEKPTKPGWSAPKEGVDQNGAAIIYRVNDAGEIDILKGIQPSPKKGMKIYDREGNLMVDMSGGAGPDMTIKTKGSIEGKIVGGKEQLARMQTIVAEFKPEYLEIGTRLKATWTGIKAKLGKNVSKDDAEKLTDFKKFQRKSIENINLYIKELTGAQMSEKEADRLRLAQPDPGENWWNGDDPITFKSKMDDVMKTTRAAVARWEYYRSKGLADEQIKAIINSDTALNLSDMASRM